MSDYKNIFSKPNSEPYVNLGASLDSLYEHPRLFSPSSTTFASSHIPRSVEWRDYQFEARRLETFHTWPVSANIGKEELAQAGFVYKPSFWPAYCMDRVQCAFCRGILKNWKKGQKAFDEHQKHFGEKCPYVKNVHVTLPPAVAEVQMKKNQTVEY